MEYRGLTLDRFQSEAIEALEDRRSVLVCAPTGTGKTIIADWVVERALRAGRKVVYTAPIKALSNQKFRDYTRLHGPERVGLVTGDLVIRREAPCLVMTTEILRNILLSNENLADLDAVVVDEIHFLDDRERGTVWEEVLIYLPKHVVIVGLSATLSNLHTFSAWLAHVRGAPFKVVTETKRAVPLTFYLACSETGISTPADYERWWKRKYGTTGPPAAAGFRGRSRDGRGRGREEGGGRREPDRNQPKRTRHSDIIKMLIDTRMLPTLYFAFSRRDIESNARYLTRQLRGDLLNAMEERRLEDRLEKARDELGEILQPELLAMYGRGIAFHHAGLHVSLKALVEELYEEKLIKILYCTSTFALGINMPARSVAFDGIRKFDGQAVNPMTVREFMQMAGRAGRRGMDDSGHVVLRVDADEYPELRPLFNAYFEGRPEPVRSSFALSWNSVVNLLGRHTRDQVREIVEKSFLAWHLGQQAEQHLADAESLERQATADNTSARRALKEAKRLRKRAEEAGSRCWEGFVERERFLKQFGYLDAEGGFNSGAKVLANLQIAEVFTSELILRGLLDDLDDPTLFGVLCGLVAEFPRKAERRYGIDKPLRELAVKVEEVRWSHVVTTAEKITQTPACWAVAWIPLGQAWVRGESLVEVLDRVASDTDIAGDVVGAFRRAKDLTKQLAEVHHDLPERAQHLRSLVKRVSRDEVEVVD